jgi:hypothetical protein
LYSQEILHFNGLFDYNNAYAKDRKKRKKMEQNKEQQILFANLQKMIDSPDYYFDEGIAAYTLSRLGESVLEQTILKAPKTQNFYVKSNFWGLVNAHFYRAHFKDNVKDWNNPNDYQLPEIKKSILNLNIWQKLLENVSPALIHQPKMVATLDDYFMNNSYEITFNAYLGLKNMPLWYIFKEKLPLNHKEERLILIDALRTTQGYIVSENKNEIANYIIDRLIEHKSAILDTFKADDNFLLKNQLIKNFLDEISVEKTNQLLNKVDIKELYKKANTKEEVIMHSMTLANAMNVAPPEQWVDTWRKGKHFNLLSFFNEKFLRGYGISLVSDNKNGKLSAQYNGPKQAILKELEYLTPALEKETLPDSIRLKWYNRLIEKSAFDLFLVSLNCIDLPEKNSNKENVYFHDTLMMQIVDRDSLDFKHEHSWKYYETEHRMNKLSVELEQKKDEQDLLSEEDIGTHLKIKI